MPVNNVTNETGNFATVVNRKQVQSLSQVTTSISQKNELKYCNDIGLRFEANRYVCEPDALRVASLYIIPESVNKIVETKVPTIPTSYNNNFHVENNLFDGSASDINRVLNGTKLTGLGQVFIDAQEKYGINAIFLMSIIKIESGYGNAPKSYCKYNISGALGQRYKSYEECIDRLANNLKKNYFSKNAKTISKIANIYSGKPLVWMKDVANAMGEISNTIMKPYLG